MSANALGCESQSFRGALVLVAMLVGAGDEGDVCGAELAALKTCERVGREQFVSMADMRRAVAVGDRAGDVDAGVHQEIENSGRVGVTRLGSSQDCRFGLTVDQRNGKIARNFPSQFDRRRICQRGGGRRGEGSMADRNRRYTFAAIALPFLLIAMAGLARANTIVVNTLDSGSSAFSAVHAGGRGRWRPTIERDPRRVSGGNRTQRHDRVHRHRHDLPRQYADD